eukprot:3425415-Prymnesium_polylepis.3
MCCVCPLFGFRKASTRRVISLGSCQKSRVAQHKPLNGREAGCRLFALRSAERRILIERRTPGQMDRANVMGTEIIPREQPGKNPKLRKNNEGGCECAIQGRVGRPLWEGGGNTDFCGEDGDEFDV